MMPDGPPIVAGYDPAAAISELTLHGAVVLRDPLATIGDFAALTSQIVVSLPHHSVATAERDAVDGHRDVATVNKGHDEIPLHSESSFLPTMPDLVALFCERPPRSAGQTTLCDGVQLLAALPADVRRFLAAEVLSWRFRLPPERWTIALGTSSADQADRRIKELMLRAPDTVSYEYSFPEGPEGCLDGTYRSPLVRRTFWGGQPVYCNSLLSYFYRQSGPYLARHLHEVTITGGRPVPADIMNVIDHAAAALTVETSWRPGDLLLVDNSRVMHGRRAVTDADRRILTLLGNYQPAVFGRP